MGTHSSSKGNKTPSPPVSSNGKGKGKDASDQSSDYYKVYRVEYQGKPNHVAIFVETHEAGLGSGFLYHVEGNILQGMVYRPKRAYRPEDSASFVPGTKVLIGRVAVTNYPYVNVVCQAISPPGKQMDLRGRKLNPNVPLRRCGEWVDEAIIALRDRRVLVN
jgi:hypothetical protein